MHLYEVERNMLVIYMPPHAKGDILHPDVEQGRVTEVRGDYVFVRFGDQTAAKACYAEHLSRAF